MPELPDITVYVESLQKKLCGKILRKARVISPFLLRTVDPPLDDAIGRQVNGVSHIGKRIVLQMQDDLHLVFHLMIAGRFRWRDGPAKSVGKIGLATFGFDSGTLLLTEAGHKKRASLHVVRGADSLSAFDRGGIDVLAADHEQFANALRRENHTLKRALTDPRLISGIGNAYSDEILQSAGLSPLLWTSRLNDEQMTRLFDAARSTLQHWIDELRTKFARRFPGPGDITAFRPEFAVHGKFGQPCPDCSATVQRIRYADNETNYCPKCQTGGRILADRSLSRLLKNDWPRTIDELESP